MVGEGLGNTLGEGQILTPIPEGLLNQFSVYLLWAMPPVRLGLSGRNSGKTPETLSERFRGLSPQEYGWDPPKPFNSRHLRLPEQFSPPPCGRGRLFFQKWFPRGPLRAGHGIPSSTAGGVSDPKVPCRP